MRKVVYTYIFNEWDWLKPPIKVTPGWRYVCFTDEKNPWLPGMVPKAWELVQVRMEYTPKRQACYFLTHGTDMFAEYDIIVSITGQCHVIGDLDEFCDIVLKRNYGIMYHPSRNCTYKEAAAVVRHGKDDPEVVKKHMERYRKEGFPEFSGMVQTGIIARRNVFSVREFERKWWKEIQGGSHRDQLSWNYTNWKFPIQVDFYNHTPEIQNNLIAVTPHYRKNQKKA